MNDFDDLEDLERELAPSLRVALHQAAAAITGEPTPEAHGRSRGTAVMRRFEGVDPVRGDDDSASFLDIVRTSSIDAEPTELVPTATEPARHRWRTIFGVAAAVLLIVAGAVVVVARNDPTHEPQVSASARASAEEVARGFLDAYGAFDADRAMTDLTKHAVAAEWRTPAELRLELSLLQATGWKQTIRDCVAGRVPGESAAGVTVYCRYFYQGLRSDEIGRGPYEDAYWAIVVDKGRIVSADNRITMAPPRPFDYQMREPFRRWVWFAYPQDAMVMYKSLNSAAWKRSVESVRLWEQHTREYVAAGAPYIARAAAICTAAHDRLEAMFGPPPAEPFESERFRAWGAMAARVVEEALVELRAVPPPEAFRDQFGQSYGLLDQLVAALRGDAGPLPGVGLPRIDGLPGLGECNVGLGG